MPSGRMSNGGEGEERTHFVCMFLLLLLLLLLPPGWLGDGVCGGCWRVRGEGVWGASGLRELEGGGEERGQRREHEREVGGTAKWFMY